MRKFVGFEVASTESMSPCWRCLPLLIYMLVVAASFGCSVSVVTTVGRLHGQCPLYAQPRLSAFDGVNVTLNEQSSHPNRTRWGDAHVCSMAQFYPAFSGIFSVVWFSFFLMCGKGGKGSAEGFGMDSPWRIVCPGLVFNVVMTLAALVNGVWTSQGVAVFCRSLDQSRFNVSCQTLDALRFTQYPEVSQLRTWFVAAQVCSWMVFAGLLWVSGVLVLRCLCRPDLVPLYAPAPDEAARQQGSTDSFVTAADTPQHGAAGDSVHVVTPAVHASAEPWGTPLATDGGRAHRPSREPHTAATAGGLAHPPSRGPRSAAISGGLDHRSSHGPRPAATAGAKPIGRAGAKPIDRAAGNSRGPCLSAEP